MKIVFRFKGFFISLGLLIGAVCMILFVTKPMVGEIFDTQARIKEDEGKLTSLSEKESFLRSTDKGELQVEAEKFNSAIPPSIDLPIIIATLDKVAKDSGVTIGEFSLSSRVASITVLPLPQEEKFSIFQFTMELTGSFENINRLNAELLTMTPLFRIESLEFAKDKTRMTISYYFAPSPKSKPKADSQLAKLTAQDKETINKVFALVPPVLVEPQVSSSSSGLRQNPFR